MGCEGGNIIRRYPRCWIDGGASFEARLRRAPQDEEGGPGFAGRLRMRKGGWAPSRLQILSKEVGNVPLPTLPNGTGHAAASPR